MVVVTMEDRASTPPRAPTPPHAVTPPREATPSREITPPRVSTPPRVPTSPCVHTPPLAPTAPVQPAAKTCEAPAGAGASAGGDSSSPPRPAGGDERPAAAGPEEDAGAGTCGAQASPRALPEVGLDAGAGPSSSQELVLGGWDWSAGSREVAFGLVRESLEGLEAHLALGDIWLAWQQEELARSWAPFHTAVEARGGQARRGCSVDRRA